MTDTIIARSAQPHLHIASIALYAQPQAVPGVTAWLTDECGAEIHAQSEQGKLVVVLESEHERRIADVIDATNNYPGVVQAALVYHEILAQEDEPS